MNTTDPALRSWVPVPPGSPFPIQNLPYGVFRRDGAAAVGVAIGAHILDLTYLEKTLKALSRGRRHVFASGSLNPFLAQGPAAWSRTRALVSELLSDQNGLTHSLRKDA